MSSSINTVSSGAKNYMSGLASGMDTDSIVESMLSGTQAKIDKQTGNKQQLEWKQDIYRDIITKINTFSDKYFSYYGSGDTNLLSSSLYNTMTGVGSSGAVKIGAVASNALSNLKIDKITQLATPCTVKSANTVTGAAVGGEIHLDQFSDSTKTYSFSVTLDGVNKIVSFQGGSENDVLDSINQVLYRNFGTSVGMKESTEADGRKTMALKQLKLDASGKPVPSDVDIDSSRRVIIEAAGTDSDTVKNLGFEGGFSNKLAYGMCLKDMNFATPLQGNRYEFEINGVTIKGLTGDSTLSDVISAINSSAAGVTVSYSSAADKFIMQSSSTGEIGNINMSQTYGNLLTTMFGVDASGFQTSLLTNKIEGSLSETNKSNLDSIRDELNHGRDQSFVLQVDGEDVTIKLEGKSANGYKDNKSVITAINSQLDRKFGTAKIRLTMEETEDTDAAPGTVKVSIQSSEYQVGFTADNLTDGIAGKMGLVQGKNILAGNTTLADAGIVGPIEVNGQPVTMNSGMTLAELASNLKQAIADTSAPGTDLSNLSVSYTDGTPNYTDADGRFSMAGLPEGTTIKGLNRTLADGTVVNLLGKDTVSVLSVPANQVATVEGGKNAIITVDGVEIRRNTNAFEIDGITVELTATSDTPINLTTSRDTDKIVDGLKSFVEDYNTLIEELNKHLTEESTYKKYPPLTEAQKKEMSDREIELWEEKSKQGLLRNDPNVSSFLSDMRSVLYGKVDSAGLALYDIGIETSNNWRDNGKLVIDEETLNERIATNAENICKLFTDKEQGVAVKLQQAIKDAANVSSGSPGSMVRYAGTKDVLVTNNTLYQEMKRISQNLANLNNKYTLEMNRYWIQFTAMDLAISNMNSHSSWLTLQFSA